MRIAAMRGMIFLGIGFAVASLSLLARELFRAPEAFEDETGLTMIRSTRFYENKRKRQAGRPVCKAA
jgi:hypothetical protein